jgi:hypothetical protein
MFNYIPKLNFQYLSIIDELGFLPRYSQYDQILYDSIHKSLKLLGKSYAKALLFNMCSLYGLSENELLMNYDLFEKSIYSILGNAGNLIIDIIKKDMLRHAVLIDPDITVNDILNPSITVSAILKLIHDAEVFNFVRNIKGGEHVIFFYENQNSLNKILSAFFDPIVTTVTPKGLLTILPHRRSESNITYNELLKSQNYKAINKFEHWISTVHSSNKSQYSQPTRIAEEDASWWLRNGFTEEFILFEESLKRYIHDSISFLCAFKISNLTHFNINLVKKLIAFHRHIILEDPLMIFGALKS